MSLHSLRYLPVALGTLLFCLPGCGGFPTFPTQEELEEELERAEENRLRAVDGDWTGFGLPNSVSIRFRLVQNGQQVIGNGWYVDANGSNSYPITVTGTFMRPTLSLSFVGIMFQGLSVTGQFVADYESSGGIYAPLRLVGEGVSTQFELFLQESSQGPQL